MTELEREKNKRELIAEIVAAVKAELWMQFLLAGISNPPECWSEMDRVTMAERLRVVADDLDPPQLREPRE
ncbi:MAG TPA: hypothetical protein VHC69_31585 [Polyangiaceae bacterium]|nr:hypothetical protein [Polyangiaceae bacterium]